MEQCPECGEKIEHEWEWELHSHNDLTVAELFTLQAEADSSEKTLEKDWVNSPDDWDGGFASNH